MNQKIRSRFLNKANSLLGLQFLSDFGDQITIAILAACLLDITQSAAQVGLVYFITTLGYIVFTLIGGFIGDFLSKRNILIYSDLGRGLVVLLMIIAISEKSILLIYCTSFLLAILGSLHRPVKTSIWTECIPEQSLEKYNSLSEFSIQASTIVGPLIASFFILKEWSSVGFAIDAITFFLCAIAFARIVARGRTTSNEIAHKTPKRDFLKGFSAIFSEWEMLKYVSYDAIQMLGFSAFNAMFLVLAQRDYGWTKAEYTYHLSILAIFASIGAFLGATNYISKMDHIAKLNICAVSCAIALAGVLYVKVFPLASILFGICDGLTVFTVAVTKTRVQLFAKNKFPDHLTSIIAARFIIIKIATLVGTGICLLINDLISLETTLAIFLIPVVISIWTLRPTSALVDSGEVFREWSRSKIK